VQRNVNILKEVGYYVLEPDEGYEVSDMEKGGKAIPPMDSLFLSLKVILAAAAGEDQPS
jgi:hypothetical protein